MGRCMTSYAKNLEWKMDGPQLNGPKKPRGHQRKTPKFGRILDDNYKKSDLYQEGRKLTHLTKFQ